MGIVSRETLILELDITRKTSQITCMSFQVTTSLLSSRSMISMLLTGEIG